MALVATPALAQPPPSAYQPPSNPSANYQPLNYQNYQPATGQQPANGQQPGGLPLPPGYRTRTPPPQTRTAPAAGTMPVAGTMAGSGGGGQVMYFQKPADALTATGTSDDTGAVAQLGGARTGPAADVPAPTMPPQSRYLPASSGSDFASAPPPPQPRYLPAPTGSDFASTPPPTQPRYPSAPGGATLADPPVTATAYDTQAKPGDPAYVAQPGQKKEEKFRPVDKKYIRLPDRSRIFTVYNDPQLELRIMQQIIEDRITDLVNQIKDDDAQGRDTADKKKTLKELEALGANPLSDQTYRFPPLPVVGPPASAYQAKTAAYAPRTMVLEPGYVVHRKLYLEDRNAERAGWDFGAMQTLVSAAYFWRDTLTMPQSFVSGFVYGHWDTGAGKCLPGSPSPYYLYPPGLTLTGTVAEGVLITGAGFIFK